MTDAGLIRAACLFYPLALLGGLWAWRRPNPRLATGTVLAIAWNLLLLWPLHVAAENFGWWHFTAQGGALLGFPVDLCLGWAVFWGALGALLQPGSIGVALVVAFGLDSLAMPHCAPILVLGKSWVLGETAGLLLCFLPAQLICRWTARCEHAAARALLQTIGFSLLVGFLIPAIVLTAASGSKAPERGLPVVWEFQLLFLVSIPGYSAVQEFCQRGRGTPLPYDPPDRLVDSGPYAFLANPMQTSTVLAYLILAVAFRSAWFAAGSVVMVIYSAGLARWHEESQLLARFGASWPAYRRHVRSWFPRWRPFVPRESRLYVAMTCSACSRLGKWIQARQPRGLLLLPAESHPSSKLRRLTYETPDGDLESGVAAFARALEHIHLGWAFAGWTLRLEPLRYIVQTVMDCVGAGPRELARVTEIS